MGTPTLMLFIHTLLASKKKLKASDCTGDERGGSLEEKKIPMKRILQEMEE